MCNNVLTIIAFKVQTSDESRFKSVSEHTIKRQCKNITCMHKRANCSYQYFKSHYLVANICYVIGMSTANYS
jgi:hypothetical protein